MNALKIMSDWRYAAVLGLTLIGLAVVRSSQAFAPLPPGYQVETFASRPGFITDIEFGPDGRLYYVDTYYMQIRVLDAEGKLASQIPLPAPPGYPRFTINLVLGLALDPDFVHNDTLYVHYLDETTWSNRVLRFRYSNGFTSDVVSLLNIPLPANPSDPTHPCTDHNGGHLAFGPDGMLYVPMGDNCHSELVQDLGRPQGSVLRISPIDGSAPSGNPFSDGTGTNDDRLWAKGMRNPFGLSFDPVQGDLWVTDNGPGCEDEVDRVIAGGNYGWPLSSTSYFECKDPGSPYLPPLWQWTPTLAPTGIVVYRNGEITAWEGSLFTCAFNNGGLHRLVLNAERTQVISDESLDIKPALCKLDVVVGPDGVLYFADTQTIYRLVRQGVWLPLIQHLGGSVLYK